MKSVLTYLQSTEWTSNRGVQCSVCGGKKPGAFQNKNREGHQPGCGHGAAIKTLETLITAEEAPHQTFNEALDELSGNDQ